MVQLTHLYYTAARSINKALLFQTIGLLSYPLVFLIGFERAIKLCYFTYILHVYSFYASQRFATKITNFQGIIMEQSQHRFRLKSYFE